MVEDAKEAEYLRQELANGWDNPKAAAALQAWDAQQQSGGDPEQDAKKQEAVAEQATDAEIRMAGGPWGQAAELWDDINIDAEQRLELLQVAKETPTPLTVSDGEGGVRDTTIEERVAAQQQGMWDSLNPVQQAWISLGSGAEAAWSLIPGMGSTSDAQDVVLDAVEKGGFNDAVQAIAFLSEAGGVVSGGLGAAKVAITGLLKGAAMGTRGALDTVVKSLSDSVKRVGNADTWTDAVGAVTNSRKGKAQMEVMTQSQDPRVVEKVAGDFVEGIGRVEGTLQKANDLRMLNPKTAQQEALKRAQKLRAARERLEEEAQRSANAIKARSEAAYKAERAAKARQDAEATLGVRGQSKRFQQEQNKAALKQRQKEGGV